MDLIDRPTIIAEFEWCKEQSIDKDKWQDAINRIKFSPRINIDVTPYFNKIWKNAYERGKAEALRWIPVSERLPNNDEVVLVYTTYGETTDGWRFDDDGWFINGGENCHTLKDILAWMPLPAPYKGGNINV